MTDKTNELLQTGSDGLSLKEVEKRRQAGLGNEESQAPTKSKAKVISEHVFTPFNLLNFVLFLIVIFVAIDRPKYIINGLFFGVAIVNTVSGTIQELKARKEVLRLSLLNQPRILVIREAKVKEIPTTELVVGDLIELRTENQIVVDAKLIKGMNLKVDESLLTGESHAVLKKDNDKLFSGSYVIAGRGLALVEKTGKETYAAKLTKEARKFRNPDSEIK
ncbi:MAG TPA: cation-translocating P-type ATPase, partial [Candidatus Eisenbacteria bacterium]|nr:cation-translocating P-type ATPase [Candidatus Eisenbacteria bacterium]